MSGYLLGNRFFVSLLISFGLPELRKPDKPSSSLHQLFFLFGLLEVSALAMLAVMLATRTPTFNL